MAVDGDCGHIYPIKTVQKTIILIMGSFFACFFFFPFSSSGLELVASNHDR